MENKPFWRLQMRMRRANGKDQTCRREMKLSEIVYRTTFADLCVHGDV